MSDSEQTRHAPEETFWAAPVERLDVQAVPPGALNLNVKGRRPTSPLQGFGQLWQKTYRIRLEGVEVDPKRVIAAWKADFPAFWPKGNAFYAPLHNLEPGEVAVLNLHAPGGLPLSTGVRVIYADDESFSFMTPEGHMFAGIITFSAFDDEGVTVIQIQALIRASDPIYETSFRLGFGHKAEDTFWFATLRNLAAHFGAPDQQPALKTVCVDKKVQWSRIGNVWQNAAIRSAVYMPILLTRRLFGRA